MNFLFRMLSQIALLRAQLHQMLLGAQLYPDRVFDAETFHRVHEEYETRKEIASDLQVLLLTKIHELKHAEAQAHLELVAFGHQYNDLLQDPDPSADAMTRAMFHNMCAATRKYHRARREVELFKSEAQSEFADFRELHSAIAQID